MEWNYLWAKVNGKFEIVSVFQAGFGEAWNKSTEMIKDVTGIEYWDVSTSYDSEFQAWQTAKLHKESYSN